MKMAFLRSTIIATCCYVSVDNSSICHEFMMFWRGHAAAPPAVALQSHCCEGKMSQNHNNTFAETAVKNEHNYQESTFNIVCVDIKSVCSMFSARKLHYLIIGAQHERRMFKRFSTECQAVSLAPKHHHMSTISAPW